MTVQQYLYQYPSCDKVRLAKYGDFLRRHAVKDALTRLLPKLGYKLVQSCELAPEMHKAAKINIGREVFYVVTYDTCVPQHGNNGPRRPVDERLKRSTMDKSYRR